MSEAATTAVEAPAAAPATTDLTGAAPAPAGSQPTTASGEGDAGKPAGQGAAAETPKGGDPAGSDTQSGGAGSDTQSAPEKYDAFTVPDTINPDGEWLSKVGEFAKAQNMTQAQAQAMVNLGVEQVNAVITDFTKQIAENPVVARDHWAKTWSDQTVADPEIGGDKLTETMGLATKVFDRFASDGLKDLLGKTGLAHHPDMIRFMRSVGKVISEDVLVLPQGSASKAKGDGPKSFEDRASKLYPDMAKG